MSGHPRASTSRPVRALAPSRRGLPNWQRTLPAKRAWQCVIAWQCVFFPENREKPSDCSCSIAGAFGSMDAEEIPSLALLQLPARCYPLRRTILEVILGWPLTCVDKPKYLETLALLRGGQRDGLSGFVCRPGNPTGTARVRRSGFSRHRATLARIPCANQPGGKMSSPLSRSERRRSPFAPQKGDGQASWDKEQNTPE